MITFIHAKTYELIWQVPKRCRRSGRLVNPPLRCWVWAWPSVYTPSSPTPLSPTFCVVSTAVCVPAVPSTNSQSHPIRLGPDLIFWFDCCFKVIIEIFFFKGPPNTWEKFCEQARSFLNYLKNGFLPYVRLKNDRKKFNFADKMNF